MPVRVWWRVADSWCGCAQVYLPNKDVMANPITGQGPEKAQKFVERMAQKTGQGGAAGGRAATGTQRAPSAGTQKRGGFFGKK